MGWAGFRHDNLAPTNSYRMTEIKRDGALSIWRDVKSPI